MANEKIILLTQLDPTGLDGGREREIRERKERGKRKENSKVRSSHFFLDFPVIDLANSGEARSKVGPHYKSYAWVLVLGSFNKLREVGVLLLLWLFLAYESFKWNGWCEAVSGRWISPKTLGLNVGNFGTDFGSSRTDLRIRNGPCMLLLYVIAWCLNNMQIVC